MNLGSGGSTYNAVMYNSPTVSVTDKVVGTAAVEFASSSSQYIQIPPFATTSSGLSISCWFKFSGSGQYSRIFDFTNNLPRYNSANSNIVFFVYFDDGSIEVLNGYASYNIPATFGMNINDGVWRHFAWTISNRGDWCVYLNGVLVQSLSLIHI